MKTVIQRAIARKEPLFAMFIDLQKAYDSIPRNKLWTVLIDELHLDEPLVKALKLLYVNLKADVKGVENKDPIAISIGLKQGCTCSPLLFSLYFDRLKVKIEIILR